VVTMTPVTADIAAPRTLTADVALVSLSEIWQCLNQGTCDRPPIKEVLAVPAYAVTQAAYLASDVVAVAGAGVAYGATVATAVLLEAIEVASDVDTAGLAEIATAPTVVLAKARLAEEVGKLKTDWANAFSPAHFSDYVEGLAGIVMPNPMPILTPDPEPEVASVHSRPVAAVASRARAAALAPRQSPSAKAAAATVETAPTAEQGQRRATRGAAHRTERSGAGRIE